MQHTFRVRTSELGTSFIRSIRSVFGNKEVRITVEDIGEVDSDASATKRFLQHRKDHPAPKIDDQRDFNEVVGDLNQ